MGVMHMTDTPSAATAAAPAPVMPSRWIGAGWAIVREDLGNFVLMTLIVLGLSAFAGAAVVGLLVVGGPLITGMFIAIRRRMLEGRSDLMDVFQGFNRFIDALLLGLLVALFGLVGLAFCIIPFFIVGAFYLFPFLFMIDRDLGFWEAMEASRKTAGRELAGYVVFFLLLCLMNLIGLMLAGIGLLVTIPISLAAIAVAYNEVVGFQPRTHEPQGPIVIP